MRTLLIAMVGLVVAMPGVVSAAVCGDPPYEDRCVINNGLAPPNPENVINDATYASDAVYVRNVGCPPEWPASSNARTPCPSPGAPTEAALVNGGDVGGLGVFDTSTVTMSGGASGYLYAYDSSTVSIVGKDFEVNGVSAPYGDLTAQTGTLTGELASGDPIDNVFYQGGYDAGYICSFQPCTGTITLVYAAYVHGDGLIEGFEECDDGNTDNGDGCDESCLIETGWLCAGEPSVCSEDCGDGVIVGTEGCDDGGTTPGDGCDASCEIEEGWICVGEPSVCSEDCGDGSVVGGEECDDGATIDGDCCSSSCEFEPATTQCRPDAGECDVEELCDGAGSCPADSFEAADSACSSGDECLMEEVCDGDGLCIGGRLSVPAPDSCPVIDNSVYFTDAAQDVVVQDNLVYVAALSAGLRIVDFSDPETPIEVASYDPPTCLDDASPVPFEAEDVVLSDPFLFVSAGACGVFIFDTNLSIDDNMIPFKVIDTDGDTLDVQPLGSKLYVASGSGIVKFDLSTGQEVDSIGAGSVGFGLVVDIELQGGLAIVLLVATGSGLRIVEDSPEVGLVLRGSYDSGNGFSQDAELVEDGDEDLVYLARWLDGLDVLNVSDPSNITLLDNVPSVEGSYEVSISGSRAVTAEGDGGIGVLDLANPSSPASLGTFASEGFTADVEMMRYDDEFGLAFVGFETEPGGQGGGLRIVQLERIGVDPMLVPEPGTVLSSLIALATVSFLVRHRRSKRRRWSSLSTSQSQA